jgi:predicted dehydrogenase
MGNPLKVAVIGVGHLGKEHARLYTQIKNIKLVAVVDANENQANTIGRKLDAKVLTDYHSLLGEVDAVSIATPTATHFEIARDFLAARTHVLLEKPMTSSLDTAQKLVELAQQNNRKLQIGHIERFNPALNEILKRNIRPIYIEAMRIGQFKFRSGDIGVVLDLMIHDIDIINLLTKSEVEKVDAVGLNVLGSHEDIANARITYACGCVANITASRASLKALRQIRIFTPEHYISLDYGTLQARIVTKPPDVNLENINLQKTIPEKFLGLSFEEILFHRILKVENLTMKATQEQLGAELESFIRCIEEDRQPVVSGEDGLKAIRIASMIQQDIQKNLERAKAKL